MASDHEPEPERMLPPGQPAEPSGQLTNRPRWTRPEITSFKPVADARGISVGDSEGLSNSP
jgi:hypothetical protein